MTTEQLQKIFTSAPGTRIDKFIDFLNKYMSEYGINTKERVCAFLAQIGHESAQLRYTAEIASGEAYEGRKDLGNLQAGDGKKYKGRGLIQITGRANYTDLWRDFGMTVDFIAKPELLEQPEWAVKSACWWWQNKGLNALADIDTEDNFKKITKIINGGYNGLADRLDLWNRAKKVTRF